MDFDEAAKTWDEAEWRITRAGKVAEKLRASLGPPEGFVRPSRQARALDLGCGTGLLSFHLRDDLREIVLLDTSKGMIERVAEKIALDDERRRASGAAAGAAMLPMIGAIEDEAARMGSFDLAYSMLALHHIPDTRGVLRALAAVLAPRGLLRIVDLDREDGSYHKNEPGFSGHEGFDRAELAAIAEDAGFREVEYETAWLERRADGDGIREYPMFLMKARVGP